MSDSIKYQVIIVGGGISGLTAASYLSKYGYKVLLIEKQSTLGGNINSFEYKGHILDGGIRSIESSGVLKPMIRDLGLNVDLVRSPVTLGIGSKVIQLNNRNDIPKYEELLITNFPEQEKEIKTIIRKINQILNHMDILYGIDNPMIIDLKKERSYVYKTLLPWFFKFVPTLIQIDKLTLPVETYLRRFTQHQPMIDIIIQHFFKATPTFFALGYFSIYFDYHYPVGGTGKLIEALESYIKDHGVTIKMNTEIKTIDPGQKFVVCSNHQQYSYEKLVWAADLKTLYRQLDLSHMTSNKKIKLIQKQQTLVKDKRGAESVLTVYATVNLKPEFFRQISSGHFFYTPSKEGLHEANIEFSNDKNLLYNELRKFYNLNTYEISIPALRDENLAPKGETGLIISILMSYDLIKHISNLGIYEEFKSFTEKQFINILSESIYPNLKDHIIETFCSTPLTFEGRTGSTDGAIIGWAYDSSPIPVRHKMSQITHSIDTPILDVYQAGQWSFSPAGVPISILTGKLSADRIKKQVKIKS